MSKLSTHMPPDLVPPEPWWETNIRYDLARAANKIMDAENWILERIPPDQKLVIIMGEDHKNQADMILQQTVLKAHILAQRVDPSRSFAFGYEMPQNMSGRTGNDNHGRKNIREFMRPGKMMAFDARVALMKFCLKNEVSVSFNDAARLTSRNVKKEYIRVEHPMVQSVLADMPPALFDRRLSCTSGRGMHVRNAVMVENAASHMERTNSRIYIQECGNSHLWGQRRFNPFFNSQGLIDLFEKSGFRTLPVLTDSTSISPIQMLFSKIIDRSVIIDDMAKMHDSQINYNTAAHHVKSTCGLDFLEAPKL